MSEGRYQVPTSVDYSIGTYLVAKEVPTSTSPSEKSMDDELHNAAASGSIGRLRELLGAGAAPNSPGHLRQTALHRATRYERVVTVDHSPNLDTY